jgi:BRCT domain type II-containing protein
VVVCVLAGDKESLSRCLLFFSEEDCAKKFPKEFAEQFPSHAKADSDSTLSRAKSTTTAGKGQHAKESLDATLLKRVADVLREYALHVLQFADVSQIEPARAREVSSVIVLLCYITF